MYKALLLTGAWLMTNPALAETPKNLPAVVEYQGVTLQGGKTPSPKTPPAGTFYATWPGFRFTEQGSEVFVQLTGAATYKERRRGRTIIITLQRTAVHLRNNRRPVITSGFPDTPVSRFRLRPLRRGRLQLEIRLRKRAAHTTTTRTVGGYQYLVVSFPHAK